MSIPARRRTIGWLTLLTVVALGIAFHERIVGSVTYAVEKGKLEASRQHLASVEAISETFRLVSRQVTPAVVRISTTVVREERTPSGPGRLPGINPEDLPPGLREFFREHHGQSEPRIPSPSIPAPRRGSGSGVIIDADNGYILTNFHVIDGADGDKGRIDVWLHDGRQMPATVVGTDPKSDLALIQIPARRLHAVAIGDSEEMEVGDWVLAIGAPFQLDHTVTQGIISAKGRNVGIIQGYEDFLQTDAAINPGNSGGPLVNMRGEVIGINTAIATSGMVQGYMGVGFAIPSSHVKGVLPHLIEGKPIVRGYLGVGFKDLKQLPPGAGRALGLEEDAGLLVDRIYPDTPADKAGLKLDDVVLAYDGKRIEHFGDLRSWVAQTPPDTEVELKVWRDGEEITVKVVIEEQPDDFFAWGAQRGTPGERPGRGEEQRERSARIDTVGMTVAVATPRLAREHGWTPDDIEDLLIVTEVDPLGEAWVHRIRPGDVILTVQGEPIRTPQSLREALTDEALEQGLWIRIRNPRTGSTNLFLKIER